jgi:hypothetical protein
MAPRQPVDDDDHSPYLIGGDDPDPNVTMIYPVTDKVIKGNQWFKETSPRWKMSSGGHRPSTRLIYYKLKDRQGNHVGGCVPYKDLEVTAYVKIGGLGSDPQGEARCIVTTGGPGQHDDCCCVYSIGFTHNGDAYAEEEGPHEPKPTIFKMPVVGGDPGLGNIGSMENRTIGLKSIIYHDSDGTHLEGYVDKDNNNQWKCFYKSINPHGVNPHHPPRHGERADLPVITHVPMEGDDDCQEMRVRYDNYWPVDLVAEKSSIREIDIHAMGGH